jgi:hypothetical protein
MVGLDHANNFEGALQTSPVGVLPRSTAETVKVYTRDKRAGTGSDVGTDMAGSRWHTSIVRPPSSRSFLTSHSLTIS